MFINTVSPLISAPGTYYILKLLSWRLLEGGAYFKIRETSNIKYQNLVTFSSKIRMKYKFSPSINQM